MATDFTNSTSPSATSLVSGILDDVQDLIKQQVQLTRKEVKEEVQKGADAAIFFATGGAVLFFGALLLGLSLVFLLHWLSAPAGSDPGKIPLWGCFALVGGPLTAIGMILAWLGKNKLSSINPLHNPATEALKENVQWATNAKMPTA